MSFTWLDLGGRCHFCLAIVSMYGYQPLQHIRVRCTWCVLVLQVECITTEGGEATSVTSSSRDNAGQQQQQLWPVDVVVLAAGVGTAELCAQLGYKLPLLHKPAAIVLTSPLQPGLLQHMVVTDTVFILQVSAHGLLMCHSKTQAVLSARKLHFISCNKLPGQRMGCLLSSGLKYCHSCHIVAAGASQHHPARAVRQPHNVRRKKHLPAGSAGPSGVIAYACTAVLFGCLWCRGQMGAAWSVKRHLVNPPTQTSATGMLHASFNQQLLQSQPWLEHQSKTCTSATGPTLLTATLCWAGYRAAAMHTWQVGARALMPCLCMISFSL
jgi:hypothetical protein